MVFHLWGLEMFSFIEKLFSKIYSHFPISAIFGEFEDIVIFANNKFLGMLFHLWG